MINALIATMKKLRLFHDDGYRTSSTHWGARVRVYGLGNLTLVVG